MPTYKALSVRQPYAWLLVNGIKTCENRSWDTKHRGTLIIHAGSKAMTKDDWQWLGEICADLDIPVPPADDPLLQTGAIVGCVYLANVVAKPDPDWELGWWDEESLAWMISAAKQVEEPIPMKGKLQLFDVELPHDVTWEDAEFYEFARNPAN
jgi:hypothetical protein